MNREIKFRGKSIFKNDWWEGFYIYSEYEKKHFIVQNAIDNQAPNGSISFAHFAEIDVKTLGQFTGLKDKNGVEIYEGDILSYGKYNINKTVIYKNSSFGVMLGTEFLLLFESNFDKAEIIGNIF